MDDEFYRIKAEKEAFVTGLTGTSFAEITCLISIFPLTVLASDVVCRYLEVYHSQFMQFVIEFALIGLGSLVCFTFTCKSLHVVGVSLVLVFTCGYCLPIEERCRPIGSSSARLQHVSCFRAGLLLLTCIAILAVDFQIFPRRFAKTETYGTGLMDIGVGGFVVSNAIVVGVRCSNDSISGEPAKLSSILALFVLGGARLLANKGVEYQEHASEYGVHWNFFFTLGSVSLLTRVFLSTLSPRYFGPVGLALVVSYQVALSCFGLENWVIETPRGESLLTQNKEGIASIWGYLGLYCVGVWLGRFHAVSSPRQLRSKGYVERQWLLLISLYAATLCCNQVISPVSRRLANLTYSLWTLAMSQQLLVLFISIQVVLPNQYALRSRSLIVDGINSHQLLVFLLANVLTGAVNLSTNTLRATSAEAFVILCAYLFLVLSGAVCVGKVK